MGLRLRDPSDYDDPSSLIYWRRILDNAYKENFVTLTTQFRNTFLDFVADGVVGLNGGQNGIDVSQFVKTISEYDVSLNRLSNKVMITLGRSGPNIDRQNLIPATGGQPVPEGFQALDISENDVFVIERFNAESGYYDPEFIGLITDIVRGSKYGALTSFAFTVNGIAKQLFTSLMTEKIAIRQKGENPQFLEGIEINKSDQISLYQDQFAGKSTQQIFELIIQAGACLSKNTEDKHATLYTFDKALFISNSFQFSFMALVTLFLMAKENKFKLPEAVFEHGAHKTYNEMVSQAFETFYNTLTYPGQILNLIKEKTYYDVFESRDGTIVVRPPRYNKIDLFVKESKWLNLSSAKTQDGSPLFVKDLIGASDSGYRFDPRSDFYISNQDLGSEITFIKSDDDLRTRVDTKYSWILNGEQPFPSGSYTDPDLLIKYGFRARSPISNPNAQNPRLAAKFSPIALGVANANTRSLSLSVWDTRSYHVGKLYYIESLNAVAYLTDDKIGQANSAKGKRILTFAMVRTVVSRKISDILASPDEVLNFGLCYMDDPNFIEETPLPGTAFNPKNREIKEKYIAAVRSKISGMLSSLTSDVNPALGPINDFSFPMFRYIPTILDLMIDVEDNPDLVVSSKEVAEGTLDKRSQQVKEENGEAIVVAGQCYATWLETSQEPQLLELMNVIEGKFSGFF